jgi:omega-amidase
MQLIGCQIDIRWEDRQKNFDKVSELLTSTTVSEGSLIVLPEMFASGFSMNVDRIYEKDPSTTETFLSELAKNYSSTVIGGLVKRHDSGKGLNTLSVYGPDGSALGSYQKNHCFSFTGESDYYLSGEDILTFDWQGLKVCPTICYDLRFPELYRRGVAAGAELFPVIASWPVDRVDHWDTLLKARAIENQAIVIGVNRVGNDPKWSYSGHSSIYDHQGKLLDQKINLEGCVSADVSAKSLREWRTHFKALNDIKRIATGQ